MYDFTTFACFGKTDAIHFSPSAVGLTTITRRPPIFFPRRLSRRAIFSDSAVRDAGSIPGTLRTHPFLSSLRITNPMLCLLLRNLRLISI
jgi:hypothetical protein